MNWIFRTGDFLQYIDKDKKALAIFTQKRYFSGRKGENVLVLDKSENGYEFTHHYKVSNIDVEENNDGYKTFLIDLVLVEKYSGDKFLDDYIYSLARIRHFDSPVKHYSKRYSRLFDAEFDAIIYDKIYVKRTVLGTMLNAMHPDHQQAFISFLSQEDPGLLIGKADIDKTLMLLMDYLKYAVIEPANYLKNSVEILKKLVDDESIDEIGFTKDPREATTRTVQKIQQQNKLIEKYLDALPTSINQIIDSESEDSMEYRKYKDLFKDSGLPFTIKTRQQ